MAAGDDLTASPPARSVRPRIVEFVQFKKARHDRAHVGPIAGMIRLQNEFSAWNQRSMCERQKLWRHQSAMNLHGIVIGLRMIDVYFRDGAGSDVLRQ